MVNHHQTTIWENRFSLFLIIKEANPSIHFGRFNQCKSTVLFQVIPCAYTLCMVYNVYLPTIGLNS